MNRALDDAVSAFLSYSLESSSVWELRLRQNHLCHRTTLHPCPLKVMSCYRNIFLNLLVGVSTSTVLLFINNLTFILFPPLLVFVLLKKLSSESLFIRLFNALQYITKIFLCTTARNKPQPAVRF